MLIPGQYHDFTFGQMKRQLTTGQGKIHIPNATGDFIYKYGTTKLAILGRYPSTSYIGAHLITLPPQMGVTWKQLLIPTPLALAYEKYYIHTYRLTHSFNFPPGNTKYG